MKVEINKCGKITIPAEIADEFNLATGSRLELIKKHNKIILKPIKDEFALDL